MREHELAQAPFDQGAARTHLHTGVIDAASYLGLGHVFTANMTGNIVLLGFGIAGGSGLPVISPLVSLAAFLASAALGGRMALALPALPGTSRARC